MADETTGNITILLVHGTWAPKAPWVEQDAAMAKMLKSEVPGCAVKAVYWTGTNALKDRLDAAKNISLAVEEAIAQGGAQKVLIIGHSHGGLSTAYALVDPSVREKVSGACFIATPFLVPSLGPAVQQHFALAGYVCALAIASGGLYWLSSFDWAWNAVSYLSDFGCCALPLVGVVAVILIFCLICSVGAIGGVVGELIDDQAERASPLLVLPTELPGRLPVFVAHVGLDEARLALATVSAPPEVIVGLVSTSIIAVSKVLWPIAWAAGVIAALFLLGEMIRAPTGHNLMYGAKGIIVALPVAALAVGVLGAALQTVFLLAALIPLLLLNLIRSKATTGISAFAFGRLSLTVSRQPFKEPDEGGSNFLVREYAPHWRGGTALQHALYADPEFLKDLGAWARAVSLKGAGVRHGEAADQAKG